ncbi:hypothetical protein A3H80_05000 [Candidatus Roizmanbacteria bacterium RIFCSPLOWO2_02_FULL_37_19]|uniref:Uncharacterized protein n=1 Tax=Candidatus Roizmanbacteria bacterium RIFCSPHIGHO2_02_FULL_37_24 TaxID=1802037 RepID=A0A1F7GZG4_9BACT|nr:MAG: hypothetical protein A2862_04375 [Candidatus Roizmanbacteria bacterium RIFCSPHIGHO2_01_FULL_38_41]OGK24154.1 MAG: hypothetical protein A3C24_02685 [Candidatus Roizmanbacteria bacterium RIFCSPHIGHO2_02_FULL_37_24]OGK32045.1 MAG: hypothetical protein A3E10_04885 [Candidatus Roizmanbacteria bacterium RIFCSPHIGHO2_12_FULL_37_23]OGK43988.1 MAG: hypothetical protein A2956_04870 [Candidatus Roizmanbacteria bacterium RIFCSPLOWO2_01_FULL_37_57]OGK55080.1 MAG: hypothetical protein A3H80_05000 [Ca
MKKKYPLLGIIVIVIIVLLLIFWYRQKLEEKRIEEEIQRNYKEMGPGWPDFIRPSPAEEVPLNEAGNRP